MKVTKSILAVLAASAIPFTHAANTIIGTTQDLNITGNGNFVDTSPHSNIVGNNNQLVDISDTKISPSSDWANIVGSNNSVGAGAHSITIGNSNSITGSETDSGSVVIGNSSTMTDAKNGVGIGDSTTVSGADSVAIGAGASASNGSIALGAGSVADRENSVSVGSADGERQITNVAAGTADTDATNVAQLNEAVASNNLIINQNIDNSKTEAITTSNIYTDNKFNQLNNSLNQRFDDLNSKIARTEKKLNAGVAGVTAIASIPYVAGNRFSYGIGVGNYQNGTATAVGFQYKTAKNTNIRVNASWDSASNAIVGIGFAGGW